MKIVLVILCLLLTVVLFEFHPAVKVSRLYIPESAYAGKTCDCQCLMDSRPWYSTFNYWRWLWVLIVPTLIFSLKTDASRSKKVITAFTAIATCYLAINLSVHLFWDIRNGPFLVHSNPAFPAQQTWDMQCADIGDGASQAFALLFGWIPASLYVGFWLAIWCFFRKKYQKKNALSGD